MKCGYPKSFRPRRMHIISPLSRLFSAAVAGNVIETMRTPMRAMRRFRAIKRQIIAPKDRNLPFICYRKWRDFNSLQKTRRVRKTKRLSPRWACVSSMPLVKCVNAQVSGRHRALARTAALSAVPRKAPGRGTASRRWRVAPRTERTTSGRIGERCVDFWNGSM